MISSTAVELMSKSSNPIAFAIMQFFGGEIKAHKGNIEIPKT